MDFSRGSSRYSMRDSNRVPRNNFSQDALNKTFDEFFSTFRRNSSEESPTNFPWSFLLPHPGIPVEIFPGIFPKFLPGISSKKYPKKFARSSRRTTCRDSRWNSSWNSPKILPKDSVQAFRRKSSKESYWNSLWDPFRISSGATTRIPPKITLEFFRECSRISSRNSHRITPGIPQKFLKRFSQGILFCHTSLTKVRDEEEARRSSSNSPPPESTRFGRRHLFRFVVRLVQEFVQGEEQATFMVNRHTVLRMLREQESSSGFWFEDTVTKLM